MLVLRLYYSRYLWALWLDKWFFPRLPPRWIRHRRGRFYIVRKKKRIIYLIWLWWWFFMLFVFCEFSNSSFHRWKVDFDPALEWDRIYNFYSEATRLGRIGFLLFWASLVRWSTYFDTIVCAYHILLLVNFRQLTCSYIPSESQRPRDTHDREPKLATNSFALQVLSLAVDSVLIKPVSNPNSKPASSSITKTTIL